MGLNGGFIVHLAGMVGVAPNLPLVVHEHPYLRMDPLGKVLT